MLNKFNGIFSFRRFSHWATLGLSVFFIGLVFTHWGNPPKADASRYIDHRPDLKKRAPPNKASPAKASTSLLVQTVNINSASFAELVTLKGIGESKAKRILAFRKRHGPFKRIKDLRRVKGIGRKTVMKLRPFLSLRSTAPNESPSNPDDKQPKANGSASKLARKLPKSNANAPLPKKETDSVSGLPRLKAKR